MLTLDEMNLIVREKCGHIRRPMTLEEIVVEFEIDEYNPEILLQHLLLVVMKERTNGR